MNEDRVEELLRELGRQRAQPSVELMERVRRRGRADRLLAVVTALSLTLSALWLVPLALLWWLPGLDWLLKAAIYAGISTVASALMILVLAGREPVGRLMLALESRLNVTWRYDNGC